eukprot:TRINITY_DN22408_c0_g1_i1.p1 TRINITY_DN22408_c0_g1~~TRINITY_DN22408_c0_g1_i1.p1  ORF type:complete len:227 (-),score=31.44 TRINITY_DN22408_c0_g1_i1:272-952(-)
MERSQPERGAFRELAEELFGMHGDEARSAAGVLWASCRSQLVGGKPLRHRNHLIFICPADCVVAAMTDFGHVHRPGAIDALASMFQQNREVEDVTLVPLEELLRCTDDGVKRARPASPVWGYKRRGGSPHPLRFSDSLNLERLRKVPETLHVTQNCRKFVATASTMELKEEDERGRRCRLFRWDEILIRQSLNGSGGSLSTMQGVLRTWMEAQSRGLASCTPEACL